MSRELAIRVPGTIADWVRRQNGSASEVTFSLARSLWQSKQSLSLADCGAGEDRLKVRLNPRVLQFLRGATHSRDSTTAVRKLLSWGSGNTSLPSAPVRAPLPRPQAPEYLPAPPCVLTPVARKPSLTRVYEANPELAQLSTYQAPAGFVVGNSLDSLALSLPANIPETPSVRADVPRLPTFAAGAIERVPDWVLVAGMVISPILLIWALFRLIDWISSPGIIDASAPDVGAEVPDIAAWIPKAPAGLGAIL